MARTFRSSYASILVENLAYDSRRRTATTSSVGNLLTYAALLFVGCAVGVYSTALGAGGAFLLTPLLLIRHPDSRPEYVATAGLTIVAISSGVNAAQAFRSGRLDPRVVALLTAVVVPSAVAGAAMTQFIPRREFTLAFAVLLLATAAFVLAPQPQRIASTPLRGWRRLVEDRLGDRYIYTFPPLRSALIAAGAGFLSSMAGIGGGPLYTPLEIRLMRMPVAVAVPTAHVVITGLALAGLALHFATGHFGAPLYDAPWLAAGMLAGNPLGKRLHRRLNNVVAVRLLAAGMLLVAVRTGLSAL
jgi:uncharacterized protein